MVKNYQKFVKITKNLKLYLFKFKKNKSIKIKNYVNDCIVISNIF